MSEKWMLYGVSENTKRLVRLYAVECDLSISEALTDLIQYAYDAHKQQPEDKA